jgi:hypothetical protein
MSDASGQGIDVDLVADSEIGDLWESFDAWRVRSFLNTAAAAEPSDVDVNDACGYLVEAGELREIQLGRWFAITVSAGGRPTQPDRPLPRQQTVIATASAGCPTLGIERRSACRSWA